ncbi:MAG: nitrite/sulfite reductase, partial [Gammaproteobacteria bacterium]|nr:nitrite/sulfite reductase [Gammaproteobacteria bacterium]
WLDHNVAPNRLPGYAIVNISLKVTGIAPGDATDRQMDYIADLADQHSAGELRVTHEQNLVLPYVPQTSLFSLWQSLDAQALASPTIGTLNDIICCPGGDFCSLANAKSIPIAEAIQRRFSDLDYLYDLGEIDLNISGCMNACGHHHVGHIGILGVDKKGEEWFQISLGGHAGRGASLGEIVGPSFSRAEVPDVIERILDVYVAQRRPRESFLECYRRIGIAPFKADVYADAA